MADPDDLKDLDKQDEKVEELYNYEEDALDQDPTIADLTTNHVEPEIKESKFPNPAHFARKLNKSVYIGSALVFVVMLFVLSTGVIKVQSPNKGNKSASASPLDYSVTSIPASSLGVKNQGQDVTLKRVSINGQLQVSNGLVLTPTSKPTKPVKGSMYLDEKTKRIYYYDGTKFVDLGGGGGNTTNVTNVTNNTNVTNVISGDSNVTNVTNIINELPDFSNYAAFLANIAYLNGTGPQTFTGNNKFAGTVLLQNTVNSGSAVQVQNSAGNSLLNIDTQNTSINVGNTDAAITQTVKIGANTAVGSNTFVTIGSTQGASPVVINSGTEGTLVKGADSEKAFVVQNSAGDNKFVVDTVNSTVNVTGSLQIVPVVGTQVGGTISSVETPLVLGPNIFNKKRDIIIVNNDASILPADYEVTVTLDPTQSAEVKAATRSDQNDFRFSYNGLEIARNITSYTDSNISFKFILKANINPGDSDTYAIYYSNPAINTPGPNYALLQLDNMDSPWTASGAGITSVADTVIRQEGTGSDRLSATAAQVANPLAIGQGALTEALSLGAAVSATTNGTQYVYSVGGYSRSAGAARTTVTRATVDANGNIGGMTTTGQTQLSAARYVHKLVLATVGSNKYVYLVGGHDGADYKTEVYKALIDPATGNLGLFFPTSPLPIGLGYEQAFTQTVESTQYMYVLGGYSGTSVQNKIYRGTIAGNGDIGAFTEIGTMPVGLYSFDSVTANVDGQNSFYLIGGNDGTNTRSNRVYRGIIDGSGNVSSLGTAGQGQLPAGRDGFTASKVVVGGGTQVIVAGGHDGANRLTSILQASIDSAGNMTAFTSQDQGQLPVAVNNHSAAVTTSGSNSYVNYIGGDVGTTLVQGPCDKVCPPPVETIVSTAEINHGAVTNISTYNARKVRDPIVLTDYPQLRFWMSSSRAGDYMSIELSGDNGNTWSSFPFSMTTSNNWEEKNITIDAQTLALVTDYRIKVTNTSTNFTAFMDDLRAGNEFAITFPGAPPTITTESPTGVSSNIAINSTGGGKVVVQYGTGGTGGFTVYDGETFAFFDISKKGDILSRRKLDSSTAFQIQNAAGNTLLTANTSKMEIIINGHIVTGGDTPTAAPSANAGLGATCAVTGNDTSGTVTITTGSAAWQSGTQCTVTFKSAYGTAPRTTITPTSGSTASRQPYVNSTTTLFTVKFNVADTASSTHTFNYFNAQ